jgi:hypothetical protein
MVVVLMPAHVEIVEQPPTRSGYLAYRGVEHVLIGAGGGVKTTDLANELESGIVQLLVAGHVAWGPQPLDIPAHIGVNLSIFPCYSENPSE